MSTYYYVDPFGEHPTVATSMLQVLENDPDWDMWPDSEVEEESVAKWVRKDERHPITKQIGHLSGWHPIRHLPTGNYLWIDYRAVNDPENDIESFNFKRYGGNYGAVPHLYDAAYVAGLVFENGEPAIWDEHQMSEYQYEQELQERVNQPGLEEFGAELVHEDLRIKNSMPKVMCDWCGIPARFVVEDTPTGTKAFCGETHMAMFLGLPIKPQGYYGYEVEMQRAEGWGGVSLTGGLEDIDEMLGKKIRKAAESSSAINLDDGDTHKIIIQRGTIPYGVIEISRAGDEVDIYSRRYHSLDSKHFKAPYQPNQTLGEYFTPDLVYTSIVSDDWMTSALRFGDGPMAEEYAAHGDMGFIARYAYEPTEHFNDPEWNETHGAEEEFAEIEWELDQQPDLFTDWMSWCERFPTDRNLHQQILIDTYREETGRIGSWDTALEWWHTLEPRTQESIINTGKVWNSFLTWRNNLMWAAEDVNQVTKDQIYWLKENRFPILINVLDPKYAKKLSVPGSLNIPISKPDQFKKTVLKRIPQRDALIIVYCANQSCDASYRAYNALKRMGYTNVFEYDAGVEGWFWPLTLEIEEKWQNRAEEYPPWVVSARKVLYGNDWWDIDWTVPDDSPAPKKEPAWEDIEWDAESDPNAYKGSSTNTPSMSSMQQMTLPTLYKQDTKGKLRQWTISVEPHPSGTGFMLVSESGLVSGNIKREEGQHITAGSQNRTPFQQAELQARSKWKKKSDKGYYDDLQKAKGQTKTLPMTAHSFYGVKNGVKSYKRGRDINYPAIAQRKYDGVRAHLQVLPNGTVRITSRSGLPTGLMLADIRNEALKLNLPDNIILDGEIYAGQKPGTTEPLHPLRLINGAVSTQTMKPKHMQILNDVDLYVYDAVLLDDPDADFVTRYRTAAKYLAPYTGSKFKLVPNYIVKNEQEMNNLFGQFLQEGYEGLMVRNAKGPYQFSRSKNLQKVKPVEDDEFEIIGYKEGTGSHEGMVIWECALPNGKTFSVVPKGTHADRKKWFQEAQQGQHVGKMLTVEYAYLTDDGVPFHPTGKNFYVKV